MNFLKQHNFTLPFYIVNFDMNQPITY